MITERDQKIIEYLTTRQADFKEIHNEFFKGQTEYNAWQRLKKLTDRGHIKRKKGVDDKYYIYYV